MHLMTALLLIIATSKVLGALMRRMRQPALVGELLAGILLGPAILGLVSPSPQLAGLSELSCFFIIFLAGLEMDAKEILHSLRGRGALAAVGGFVVPFVGGLLLGTSSGFGNLSSFFIAICLSITALPVAVRILGNLGLLQTPMARLSIVTALLNDIVAIFLLGIVLELAASGAAAGGASVAHGGPFAIVAVAALKFSAFALVIGAAAWTFKSRKEAAHPVASALERVPAPRLSEIAVGGGLLFALLLGALSDSLGSHYVVGAFFAGLLLGPHVLGQRASEKLQDGVGTIVDGFLAPLFFAFLGLHFSLDAFKQPGFLAALVGVAVVTKFVAGWLGARWAGLGRADSLGVGIVLNGRGIMELVIANVAFQRGFIDQGMFGALVFMGIFTTMMTPLLLKRFVIAKRAEQDPGVQLEPPAASRGKSALARG